MAVELCRSLFCVCVMIGEIHKHCPSLFHISFICSFWPDQMFGNHIFEGYLKFVSILVLYLMLIHLIFDLYNKTRQETKRQSLGFQFKELVLAGTVKVLEGR